LTLNKTQEGAELCQLHIKIKLLHDDAFKCGLT